MGDSGEGLRRIDPSLVQDAVDAECCSGKGSDSVIVAQVETLEILVQKCAVNQCQCQDCLIDRFL